jgi:integrase
MASVRFYIEKRRDERGRMRTHNIPILLYFSYEGRRLQLHTGEKVDFGEWDSQRQRVRDEVPGSKALNRYLQSLAQELLDIYRGAKAMGMQPGPDYLRKQLKYPRNKDQVDFFNVLIRFIDENHERWSIHTFRKARSTYNHLRAFEESEGTRIDFNRIDKDFLDRYVRFFRIKFNHSNTTISKNLSVLKWFINWATEKGYNKNLLYRDYQLDWEAKPRLENSDLVLDWDELMRISVFSPSGWDLKEVRDIFCFMCFSGLKLSRVNQVREANVFNQQIRMPGKNEEKTTTIPLNEKAHGILKEYLGKNLPGEGVFPHFDHSRFNQLLKKLGREAGIDRFVNLEILAGSERGRRQVPKYEILSSRVAVNTFLFHGLRLGISPEVLAYVSGYKTLAGIERFRPLIESLAGEDIQRFNHSPDGS